MTSPYMPIKVYLAAPFEERPVMLYIKEQLEKHGVIVTSTWLTPDDNQSMNKLQAMSNKHDQCRKRAIVDFVDIDEANYFVVYKPSTIHKVPTTGGHHVETGYALGKGKPVIVYGERENVFHYHPSVLVAFDLEALLDLLHV